tara:strand:- start:1918 stop:2739 length:822 start_codon:yes stop_codon:yes gene_type:complete
MKKRLLLLGLCLAIILLAAPILIVEAVVDIGDINYNSQPKYDPAALIETYDSGKVIIATTAKGITVNSSYAGYTAQGNPVVEWYGVEVRANNAKAEIVNNKNKSLSLAWNYGVCKRNVAVTKKGVADKYTVTVGNPIVIKIGEEENVVEEEFEITSTILLQDNENLIWMKDLILWTESEGYNWIAIYFDSNYLPEGLSDKGKLEYWQVLQATADEYYPSEVYIGEPKLTTTTRWIEEFNEETGEIDIVQETITEPEDYTIMGRYNSNPWEIEQ